MKRLQLFIRWQNMKNYIEFDVIVIVEIRGID